MHIPTNKSEPTPNNAVPPSVAQPQFPVWLFVVLLMLATIAIYWPALRCDFVSFDDPDYVTANPHVQGGLSWEGMKWAFSNTGQGDLWVPLVWLSHMLACQVFGLNPWGHHLINVLLHAANTALVFLVFRQMTGAMWRSLFLAALFGWHPLRVESVAWVTERKDVLSTLFWMLTLWAYAKYVETSQVPNSKSKVWYGTTLVMFMLGLMSKAMLVTMPFVLLLLDYWPLKRISDFRFQISDLKRLLLEKIPFFALAAVASVLTFVVQQQVGAVTNIDYLPLGARVANALISYCRYLGKMFWPTDMAVLYPHPWNWPLEKVLLAGVLLYAISVFLFAKRCRYPFALMGWLWFLGTLVPVIGLVQVGAQSMADRYTYIPSVGILILTIWGACELTRRWRHQAITLPVAGLAVIVLCIVLTRQQLGYWKDSETLFRHTIEVTENNYTAHIILGNVLMDRSQTGEAINQYQDAIRLAPNYADAHNNLGNALLKMGRTDKAISEYREAILIKPDYADVHLNLGIALLSRGQANNAISQFQEAIRLKPNYADAYFSLGNALISQGKADEAISQFQEAVRLNPDAFKARNNLGVALFNKGQVEAAIIQFQEAIRCKPDFAEAQDNLAKALELKSKSNAR